MRLKIAHDAASAANIAAAEVARTCADAVAIRGQALVAFSGGETPWLMLRELCHFDLPWQKIFVAQVDERVASRGDARRNFTRLEQILVREGPLPPGQLLPMPVESEELAMAATDYQAVLETRGGMPLQLDLVQLGLGTDGHTASLVPGDAVLHVNDRDVAVTSDYQGLRRMTLTLPAINRTRRRLWLVTGASKNARLGELLAGAGDTPATAVSRDNAVVVADESAAAGLKAGPYPG